MSADHAPALVAVDWGTSSFRAGLLDASGDVLDRVAAPDGILSAGTKGFAGTLFGHIGHWVTPTAARPPLPIILSGMIGSRNGWVEVPHVATTADLATLGRGSIERTERGSRLVFISGLSHLDADGIPDVMRGEEVQVFGALGNADDAEVILPGTHSKWVTVSGGTITGFRTYMTGELFAAIKGHTIIGQLAAGDAHDDAAFGEGVARGFADPAPTHAVFTARTLALAGRLKPEGVASYLSGVLIGAEFAGGLAASRGTAKPRLVIGDARLVSLYLNAADRLEIELAAGPDDAAFRGLHALAQTMGLIP
jgi:2-dehydro-3-deoxygalactonokinase